MLFNIFIFTLTLFNNNNVAILFFTGGSNFMSRSIYSTFLNKLNDKIPVYKLEFNKNNNYTKQINDLTLKYNNLIIAGHSSGCTTAINNCNNNIKNMILLDPVKTPNYNKNIDLSYINNIFIINAGKSYEWSPYPPFLPFIPIFKLEKHDILNLVKNTNNINYVKSKIKFYTFSKFGHADIINYPYRDLMHYSRIAKGYNKRNNENIEKYYDTIIKIIYYFLLDSNLII